MHISPKLIALGLVLATTQLASAAGFTNGSFEINDGNGSPNASLLGIDPGNMQIAGWEVFGDIIDLHSVVDTGIPAAHGEYSLDFGSGHPYLNGITVPERYSNGGIRQTFDTIAGLMYIVKFDFGGFKDVFGGPGEPVKDMIVSADGFSDVYAYDTTNLAGIVGWRTDTFRFLADDSSATLSFLSLDQDLPAGVYLDNVSVQAVPEPATLAAIGAGIVGLIRRRRK